MTVIGVIERHQFVYHPMFILYTILS